MDASPLLGEKGNTDWRNRRQALLVERANGIKDRSDYQKKLQTENSSRRKDETRVI